MKATRIDQVAIAVADLDEAVDLYRRAFGIEVVSRTTSEVDGVEEAMLEVGGVYIQLLRPTREDSPVGRFLARNGPGLHHVGFGVDDVASALDDLRSEGIEVIDEVPRRAADGTHDIAFIHPRAVGGVLVELVGDTIADGDAPEAGRH